MNTSQNETVALLEVRLFGAFSFLFLALINTFLNILLIIVLYKNRKYCAKNAFYAITYQLILCDMIVNVLEFIIPIPITFVGYNFYGETLFLYTLGVFETFSYNGTLFFSFLMTINRITVFVTPKLHRYLFVRNIKKTIGVLWLFLAAVILSWNGIGTYKSFDAAEFHYHFVYTAPKDSIASPIYDFFFATTGTYLPIFMFITYIFMIVIIITIIHFDLATCKRKNITVTQSQRAENQNTKREFRLLAQAFVICGVLELENVGFNYLPRIGAPGQWHFIVTFIGRWMTQILTSINAIVLFSFNTEIRKKLKGLCKLSWDSDVAPVSFNS